MNTRIPLAYQLVPDWDRVASVGTETVRFASHVTLTQLLQDTRFSIPLIIHASYLA